MIVPNSECIGHIKFRPNYTRDTLTLDTLNKDKLTFVHSTQGILKIIYFFQKYFLRRQIKIGHIKPRHIKVNI